MEHAAREQNAAAIAVVSLFTGSV